MVKSRNKHIFETFENQGEEKSADKASKIGPSTPFELCSERLNPFGGLLGLVKFLDLIEFRKIFDGFYKPPSRKPKQGRYFMFLGLIMPLFIGF